MRDNDVLSWDPSFFDKNPIMRWLVLADRLAGGESLGDPIDDPAQALFMIYLIARACRHKQGHLVYREHQERLGGLLRQFSKPLGGESEARYTFWRFQRHGFWRIQSWAEFCQEEKEATLRPDAPADDAIVGYCEELPWKALMHRPYARYDMAKSLLDAYWPADEHAAIRNTAALPEGPRRR